MLSEKKEQLTSPTSYLKPHLEHFNSQIFLAAKGPEFDLLNSIVRKILNKIKFKVSRENNRMGYRLSGPPLEVKKQMSMITSSVLPGTVQLTPSGQLIILMRDCQTTGGYPRVLQLSERSINQLAQKKTGDEFFFLIT